MTTSVYKFYFKQLHEQWKAYIIFHVKNAVTQTIQLVFIIYSRNQAIPTVFKKLVGAGVWHSMLSSCLRYLHLLSECLGLGPGSTLHSCSLVMHTLRDSRWWLKYWCPWHLCGRPGLNLTQPWLSWIFGKWTSRWGDLSLSSFQVKQIKKKIIVTLWKSDNIL